MTTMIICKIGDRGVKVRVVQRMLHLVSDGVFGKLTEEAVKDFQASKGLEADGIVGKKTWLKLIGCQIPKSKRMINDIIVHCSDTRAGMDFTVEDIRRWHKERGWSDIGYHFVIYRDGSVHEGRNIDLVGAHCQGHNTHSIGVCYIGGRSRDGKRTCDTRTRAQVVAMEKLVTELAVEYGADIHGHRDYDSGKACPCFNVRQLLR